LSDRVQSIAQALLPEALGHFVKTEPSLRFR
jgi:hypothetical protein